MRNVGATFIRKYRRTKKRVQRIEPGFKSLRAEATRERNAPGYGGYTLAGSLKIYSSNCLFVEPENFQPRMESLPRPECALPKVAYALSNLKPMYLLPSEKRTRDKQSRSSLLFMHTRRSITLTVTCALAIPSTGDTRTNLLITLKMELHVMSIGLDIVKSLRKYQLMLDPPLVTIFSQAPSQTTLANLVRLSSDSVVTHLYGRDYYKDWLDQNSNRIPHSH
ncbi:hypothetical protein VNO77_02846 [Canavalia gladiata]|uniref:Uncharacterized protein n=1 Tax=Canavalia gladiata TaxID=3824 RepID=A0AAN9R6G0_CANGL